MSVPVPVFGRSRTGTQSTQVTTINQLLHNTVHQTLNSAKYSSTAEYPTSAVYYQTQKYYLTIEQQSTEDF